MGRQLSKRTLLAFVCGISTIDPSFADYCEWGVCKSREHCCGDNVCCNDSTTFFMIAGICAVLLLLIPCCRWCFLRLYYGRSGQGIIITQVSTTSYMTLPTEPDSRSMNHQQTQSPVIQRYEMPIDQPRYSEYPPPYA